MKTTKKGAPVLQAAIVFVLLLGALSAFGEDFTIRTAKDWQRKSFETGTGFRGTIFKNPRSSRNEMVVIGTFETKSADAKVHQKLGDHRGSIESLRASLFSDVGLGAFTILTIEKRQPRDKKFSYVQVIHGMFKDLQSRDVQMLERQYLRDGRMWVVTYLIDAPALNDRARGEMLLDGFSPLPKPSRMPASALDAAAEVPTASRAAPGAAQLPNLEYRDLDMTKAENKKRCEHVPAQKRRTPADPSLLGVASKVGLNFVAGMWGCAKGAVHGVVEFISGTIKLVIESGKFFGRYGWSWLKGDPYKDQVHAAVGTVISQFAKDPAGASSRIVSALAGMAANYAGDFFSCFNTETQAHAICKLAATLHPVAVLKLAAKAPMAAQQIAQLARQAKVIAEGEIGAVRSWLPAMTKPDVGPKATLYQSAVGELDEQVAKKLTSVTTRAEDLSADLARMSDDQIRALLNDWNPVVRRHAAAEVVNRPADLSIAVLTDTYHGIETRRRAALALDKIKSDEARAALMKAVEDADPELRLAAARALAKYHDPETRKLFAKLVDDSVPEIEQLAIEQVRRNNIVKAAEAKFNGGYRDDYQAVLLNGQPQEARMAAALIGQQPEKFQLWALKNVTNDVTRAEMADVLMAEGASHRVQQILLADKSDAVVGAALKQAAVNDPATLKLIQHVAETHSSAGIREIAVHRVNLGLAMRLPTDDAMKARQGKWLLELRALKEAEGKFRSPEQARQYEVLRIRNENIGLIAKDVDGRAFLESARKFEEMTRAQKREWIQTYGLSQHSSADATILGFLYREADNEMQWLLREVALRRNLDINYKSLPKYEDFLHSQFNIPMGGEIVKLEARTMPTEILTKLLGQSDHVNVARNAAQGLRGRNPDFITQVSKHPLAEVRLEAVRALEGHFTTPVKEALLARLKDRSPEVARAAAKALLEFRDLGVDQLIAQNGKKLGKTFMESIPKERWRSDPATQSMKLAEIAEGSPESAMRAVQTLGNEPVEILQKAFGSANDASVRLAIAEKILERPAIRNSEVIEKVLADQVDEIRQIGVQLLGKDSDLRWNRNMLKKIFMTDDSQAVRTLAKKHPDSLDSVLAPRTSSRPEQLAAMRFDLQQRHGLSSVADKDIPLVFLMKHVYEAAEWGKGVSPRELVERFVAFSKSTPLGFQLVDQMGGPMSGLKSALYRGTENGKKKLFLAFGGTETKADAVADINLGIQQARSFAFKEAVEKTVREALARGEDIVLTGHSLGGGQAQYAASYATELLMKAGVTNPENRLRVVTWNAFGAVEPLKRMGRYDAAIAGRMNAMNYYSAREDAHRLGTHIGATHRLPGNLEIGRIANHKSGSLADSIIFDNGLSRSTQAASGKVPLVSLVSGVIGPLTDRLQRIHFASVKARKVVENYIQAKLIYAAEHEYKSLKPAFDWLRVDLEDAIRASGAKEGELRKLLLDAEMARQKILRDRRAINSVSK